MFFYIRPVWLSSLVTLVQPLCGDGDGGGGNGDGSVMVVEVAVAVGGGWRSLRRCGGARGPIALEPVALDPLALDPVQLRRLSVEVRRGVLLGLWSTNSSAACLWSSVVVSSWVQ